MLKLAWGRYLEWWVCCEVAIDKLCRGGGGVSRVE